MFARLFSTILIVLFIIQPVTASETTRQGLKTIYNEYQYSLRVDWDQRDQVFLKKTEETFKKGLEELRLQGMTNEELVEFASTQFKDEKIKADFNNLILLIKLNSLKPNEVNQMVNKIVKDGYQRGARWNGEVIGKTVGIILIVGFFALVAGIIIAACTSEEGCECEGDECSDSGSDWDDGWDDDDYNDDWYDDGCTTYYDEYGEWSDC